MHDLHGTTVASKLAGANELGELRRFGPRGPSHDGRYPSKDFRALRLTIDI